MIEHTHRNARIVVIGAGHAAGRFVERLIHSGYGGEIVLVGEEAYPPYERPFLSKTMLLEEMEPPIPTVFKGNSLVTHLAGRRAVDIDTYARRVTLCDGIKEAYDILVLATGLHPRRLANLNYQSGRVLGLTNLNDARNLRTRLRQGGAISLIGAGFISLEVASSARALGVEVDIIERLPLPLMRVLPRQLGHRIAALHRQEGSKLHLGRNLTAVSETTEGLELTLDNDEICKAATVITGIGGLPRTELAAIAGIEIDDGIVTDATGKSSDAAIYAIGDVARKRGKPRLESWRNAEDSAIATAAAILGLEPPMSTGPASFWTDQLSRRIQILGLPEEGAELWHTGDVFSPGHGAFMLKDGQLCQAIFVSAPKIMRAARDCFRQEAIMEKSTLDGLGFQRVNTEACIMEEVR